MRKRTADASAASGTESSGRNVAAASAGSPSIANQLESSSRSAASSPKSNERRASLVA
jgi:hypothetical protein